MKFPASRGLSRRGKMKREERDRLPTSFLSRMRSRFLNNQWRFFYVRQNPENRFKFERERERLLNLWEQQSAVGSMIVSVQSNKARALHIKRYRFWKPVSFVQKFGRRLHQTARRKPAEVSLLSFHFPRRGRPLLAGKTWKCTRSTMQISYLYASDFPFKIKTSSNSPNR